MAAWGENRDPVELWGQDGPPNPVELLDQYLAEFSEGSAVNASITYAPDAVYPLGPRSYRNNADDATVTCVVRDGAIDIITTPDVGDPTEVGVPGSEDAVRARICTDTADNPVVVWECDGNIHLWDSVYTEVQWGSGTNGTKRNPVVTKDQHGDLFVAWWDDVDSKCHYVQREHTTGVWGNPLTIPAEHIPGGDSLVLEDAFLLNRRTTTGTKPLVLVWYVNNGGSYHMAYTITGGMQLALPESQLSYDVRPAISWGYVLSATPESKYSMSVRPSISWGLTKEAEPESQFSYAVRPEISLGIIEVAEPESKYSMEVRPEISLLEGTAVSNGFYTGNPTVPASVAYRDDWADVATGDKLCVWITTPASGWAGHVNSDTGITEVQRKAGALYVKAAYAVWGGVGAYRVYTIDEGSHTESPPYWGDNTGITAHGLAFLVEADADEYYARL